MDSTDPIDALIRDLLDWIGPGRPYHEVMDAWRTSCPRLPVWEDANERAYIEYQDINGSLNVIVSAKGARFLARFTERGPQGNLEEPSSA